MTTHSSILTWRIPMDRGGWQAIDHGVIKSQDMTEATQHARIHGPGLVLSTSPISFYLFYTIHFTDEDAQVPKKSESQR